MPLLWQASSWEHGAHEADAQREAREAESAAAVQSMRSEVQTLQQRLDDAGTASEQSTTTHQSELASEAKRRKELGDKVCSSRCAVSSHSNDLLAMS